MKIKPGDYARDIRLPSTDGTYFVLNHLEGKPYMISFFRFAGCPMCNMRVHELTKRYDELGKDFTVVGIFNSSVGNLRRHMNKHHAPFPILADSDRTYYRVYGIEYSLAGVIGGVIKRWKTVTQAVSKGFVPLSTEGNKLIMPAEFLVDREGVIRTVYYGKDEGDHMPFETIKEFALSQQKVSA
jgi:peroxiredoxin